MLCPVKEMMMQYIMLGKHWAALDNSDTTVMKILSEG